MAIDVIEGTAAEIADIVALDAAEAGLPRKGVPIGPGPHAPIDPTPGRGWSMRRIEAEPDGAVFTLDVDATLEELPAKLAAKGKAVDAAKVAAKLADKKPKKDKPEALASAKADK